MAIGTNCEACGKQSPTIQTGPLAGQRSTHSYCESCSKDLCDDCMLRTSCPDSDDAHHTPYADYDDE